MAGRISCCMNLHLPPLDPISGKSFAPRLKTTSHISWKTRTEDDENEPRKNKCSLAFSVAAATIMIGTVQVSDVASVEAAVVKSPVKEMAPRRWSDKRACPPWLQNSLETIVPENLPRPSSHRRLELAGLGNRDAPVVGEAVTRVNRATACFSM